MLSDEQYKAIRKAEYDAWCKGDDGDQYRRIAEYAYAEGQRAAFEEAARLAENKADKHRPRISTHASDVTWTYAEERERALLAFADDLRQRAEELKP